MGFFSLASVEDLEVVSLVNRGAVLALQGSLEEAQNVLEQAVRISPRCKAAINNFIYVLLRRGHNADVIKMVQRI